MKYRVLFLAVAAALAGAALAQERNTIGRDIRLDRTDLPRDLRFEVLRLPIGDALLSRFETRIDQSKLPPLKTRVVLKPKTQVSAKIKDVIRPYTGLPGFAMARVPDLTGLAFLSFELQKLDLGVERTVLEAREVERIELIRPNVINPSKFKRRNLDARLSHWVDYFEDNIHKGQGEKIVAAVIDGGSVRKSHVEFELNRVTVREPTSTAEDSHATHVAGTMAARGARVDARGMAPKLKLLSFQFDDDLIKLHSVAKDIQVSNHSYGPSAGWAETEYEGRRIWLWWGDTSDSAVEDSNFGRYDATCQQIDEILVRFPILTSVVAAGNDRNDGPERQPIQHFITAKNPTTGELQWVSSEVQRNLDGSKSGGLDTLSGLAVCKNTLTVGALNDIYDNGAPIPGAQLETTYFSSWGPTDDGRIKPEVAANGYTLLSATTPPSAGSQTPDKLYVEKSGTSMASPTAAGIVAILAEYFEKVKRRKPTSADMRGLLAHSAFDAGLKGPDPMFGYGSINALRAGEIIKGEGGAVVESHEIANGSVMPITLKAAEGPVRVTIAWIDPQGDRVSQGLNDRTPVLVNNLDLEVISPAGKIFHPYRLDLTDLQSPAKSDGPNKVDNLEVVDAPTQPGTWTVNIRGTSIPGGGAKQRFALIATGLKR